jgi:hypothetical protein
VGVFNFGYIISIFMSPVFSQHNYTTPMAAQKSPKKNTNSRKRNVKSKQRLRSLIDKGQQMDVGIGKSEGSSLDRSDLRPEGERAALLLWVWSNHTSRTNL